MVTFMQTKTNYDKLYSLELSIAIIIFLVLLFPGFADQSTIYGELLTGIVLYTVFLLLLFAAYTSKHAYGHIRAFLYLYNAIFLLLLVSLMSIFLTKPAVLSLAMILNMIITLATQYYGAFLFSVLSIFIASVGTYLLRSKNEQFHKYGYITLWLILVVLIVEWFYVSHYVIPDDEMLQPVFAFQELSHGLNPYAVSFAGKMFNASKYYGAAVTKLTTNSYIGTFSYPFLYEIISIPFFAFLPQTVYNLTAIDFPTESLLFLFIMIVALLFNTNKRSVLKPKFTLIIFLSFLIALNPSPILYLLSALLILCYQKLDSRYSWAFIGLAVSLQEQLWFPSALLILYYVNNNSFQSNARMLTGVIAVFLLFNGYFIFANLPAYLGSIFSTAISYQLPNMIAPIGYFILTSYHVQTTALNDVFMLVMLFLAGVFTYLNKKELVAIFSFVPYLFLPHSLVIYYALPALLFSFILFTDMPKERTGWLRRHVLHTNSLRYAFYLFIAMTFFACIAVIYYSHLNYLNEFNFTIVNQSVSISGNNTIYTGTLLYHEPVKSIVYLGMYVESANIIDIGVYLTGFSLSQLLAGNASQCVSYSCMQNMNEISLNESNSSFKINATLSPFMAKSAKNSTIQLPINFVKVVVYNGRYYYASNMSMSNDT